MIQHFGIRSRRACAAWMFAAFAAAGCTNHEAASKATAETIDGVRVALRTSDGQTITSVNYVVGADPKNVKALANVCAAFCRSCAKACEPHAERHVECKACMECAKACDALSAAA